MASGTYDPIESLVRRADEASAAPAIPADLAERVRGIARRRRTKRMTFAAAALLAGAALATSEVLRRAGDAEANAARIRAEIDRLDREADSLESIVRRMASIETRLRAAEVLRQAALSPDPAAEIREGVDEAAAVLIGHADHVRRNGGTYEDAADAYRRVIHWFGGTRWAAVARERLEGAEKL